MYQVFDPHRALAGPSEAGSNKEVRFSALIPESSDSSGADGGDLNSVPIVQVDERGME